VVHAVHVGHDIVEDASHVQNVVAHDEAAHNEVVRDEAVLGEAREELGKMQELLELDEAVWPIHRKVIR
jgi:hypothetical protein